MNPIRVTGVPQGSMLMSCLFYVIVGKASADNRLFHFYYFTKIPSKPILLHNIWYYITLYFKLLEITRSPNENNMTKKIDTTGCNLGIFFHENTFFNVLNLGEK